MVLSDQPMSIINSEDGKELVDNMKAKRILAVLLTLAILLTVVGCAGDTGGSSATSSAGSDTASTSTDSSAASTDSPSSAAGETPGETTVKMLFKGPKADGYDDVYQEFLSRTKDTLNINLDITFVEHADYKEKLNLELTSGTDYDIVYDAPWLNLRTLAADGYYADLSEYFNNDAYPGLKAAFSSHVMENNKWYGSMCYIPLYRTFGNGVPAVHYRQDWADEWGIGEIDSYDKLVSYWDKAKEEGILPFSVTNSRGFFQMFTIAGYFPGAAEDGITMIDIAKVSFMAYVKDGQLVALAPQGAGDEAFAAFPKGWNRDFAMDRFETFAEWNGRGYISPDSLTITDANTPFWSGQSASTIGTLDDIENNARNIPEYSPEAVIGEFIYDEGIRGMQDAAIPTTFQGNNGLCIPDNSANKESAIRFLDWLFGSQENHDLFELGIEGKDYSLNGDSTYTALTVYPANWPGYGMTWNPNYVTFSDLIQGTNLEYRKYELNESAFVQLPLSGFAFDASDVEVASYVAQVTAVSDKVALTKLHGILSDGTNNYDSAAAMMNANIAECYGAGLQEIQDELERQINEFLAA